MAEKNPQNCITPIGVVSFPNLWTPKAFQPGKPAEYSTVLVFSAETDLSILKAAIKAAAVKKFGADYKEKGIVLRTPLRKTEEYTRYGEPFTTNPGGTFISCGSTTPPGIVDARAQVIMTQSDIYAGCLARVSVYCHPYDTAGNKGVKLLLNNFQKAGEGKRLSGRLAAEQEFERLETASSADSDDI